MNGSLSARFLRFVVRDESLPLTIRLFRLICAMSVLICLLVVLPMNIFAKLPAVVNVADVLFGLFSLYSLWASWRGRHHLVLYFLVLLGSMSPMWFLNAGSQGSITFYYFAAILYPIAMFRGRTRQFLAGLLALNICSLFILEYLFPTLSAPFQHPSGRLMDLVTGALSSCFITAIVGWLILDTYDREQTRLSILARDITASEENFRGIFNSTNEAIFIHDAETGRIIDVNGPMLKQYGYERKEEVVGGAIGAFSSNEPPYTNDRAQELLQKVRQQGTQVFEWLAKRRDGSKFWVEVSLCGSQIAGKGRILAVCRDITDRKKADEERSKLEVQNRQLQKTESLGRMAGAIAHHFNNQLQTVLMNLQLAESEILPHQNPANNLAEAIISTRKAAEVSGLMLTYLGQTPGKKEVLDISEISQRHLPMLRAGVSQNTILSADLPLPGPMANANANQLQQVLTNLVANAWESIGNRRGAIRLSVHTVAVQDMPAIHRFPIGGVPQSGAYACLEVADEGCGIPESDIDKIFDPFFSTKFTGRGLGLAVVLGIVKSHQGFISVKSKPGVGSVFRVYLPLDAAAAPQKTGVLIRTPKIAGKGTVLVVDDERSLLKAVSQAVKCMGFTPLEASDGMEAIEVFQRHRQEIRLVICDLTMPRMGGWEALAEMRKLAPGIPVILCSGYSEVQAMAGTHDEQPQAFLSKPYEFETLSDTVARVLQAKPS